jgi:hypothetical protein
MANGVPARRQQFGNTSAGTPESNPLANFAHWAWYGSHPGGGLNAVPSQFLQMFNPTTKDGIVNILSAFAGGKDFNAAPHMEELGMPGQFESYSTGKAASGGHLGADQLPEHVRALLFRMKQQRDPTLAKQMLHDYLFSGEVHAKGSIPRRPVDMPPTSREAAIQRIAAKTRYKHNN